MEEEEARLVKPGPAAGEDLSDLSVEELNERIAIFESEIERIKAELAGKHSTKSEADSLFKL